MPWYRVPLPLALLCLWLCRASLALSIASPTSTAYNILFPQESARCPAPAPVNTAPCQPSPSKTYSYFRVRHIPAGAPANLDQNKWKTFLNSFTDNRIRGPTVSYLKTVDENNVKAVCSPKGGKKYKDNLCISMKKFTYTTVHSKIDTNGKIVQVYSVIGETKHLILACDKVVVYRSWQCLPVHFEWNPYSDAPGPHARGCGA